MRVKHESDYVLESLAALISHDGAPPVSLSERTQRYFLASRLLKQIVLDLKLPSPNWSRRMREFPRREEPISSRVL
jgi:hypothetical protein